MAEAVVIAQASPEWAGRFAALRERIAAVLGDAACAVEHIGSTAVPGLAAKPVVDIDVVVRSGGDAASASARLAASGYVPEGDLGVPGRWAFRSPPGRAPHHLYVCVRGTQALREHLAFRDALRRDAALSARYAALKHEAARRHGADRAAYTAAKSEFVLAVLGQAGAVPDR